nr:hypothetical protein [uncultured Draconibacterium sp.]
MAETNFVDYVRIHCQSGNGGSGSAHLRREKFVAKGGLMVAMVVVEAILFLWEMSRCGHCYI